MEKPGNQPPHRLKGSGLEVATFPSNTRTISSERVKSSRLFCRRNVDEKGNRRSFFNKMAIQTFCRPKEGSRETPNHPRSVPIKQNDCVPQFQNVNPTGGPQEPTAGRVYLQYRPKRRLLACPDHPKITTFPGVQIQSENVPVQGHALWFECSTTRLHKSYVRSHENRGRCGNLGPPVLGRYSDSVAVSDTKPQRHANSPKYLGRSGVFDKLQEIKTDTSKTFSVAGNHLGPWSQQIVLHPQGNMVQVQGPPYPCLPPSTDEEADNVRPRFGELDGQRGSMHQTMHGLDKENSTSYSKSIKEFGGSTLMAHASKVTSMDKLHTDLHTIRVAGSGVYHHDGCVTQRLGH